MSYLKALKYLESFTNYEKYSQYSYPEALSLKRVQLFLDSIGNPQNTFRSIHVAGTKGKGSTSAFITYILKEAGYKVGLYTSPHLSDFRERIRILNNRDSDRFSIYAVKKNGRCPYLNGFEGMIPKYKFAVLITKLKPAIEKYNRISQYGPLTFFEVCTAAALRYFKEEQVDFAVLETGLGGKLDATNAVNPLVSVITPISYEHMDKLGHTLAKIATEKAGIIKNNGIIISAPQEKETLSVIRNKCKNNNAKLLLVGKNIEYSGTESRFKVTINKAVYDNLKIKLTGAHQVVNAAVALSAVESLRRYGIKVSVDSIKRGLYNTLWPGRCEVIGKNPLVILDGAQNSASANVLKKAIKEKFRYQRLILVLGVSSDKDIQGIAKELHNLADTVILTKANTPRAAEPLVLKKYFLGKGTGRGKEIHITDSVKEAKKLALQIANKEDLILVTGSLFVVGEFRK